MAAHRGSLTRIHRVGLIDDHEAISVALAAATNRVTGLSYLGSSETVEDFLLMYPDTDLVVLDLRLADGSSPANNVDRLTSAGLAVVIYTSGEDRELVRAVARTHALGMVRKSAPLSTLVDALMDAAEGRPMMSTELAAAMDSDPELPRAALSAQERRVLALFARGNKAQTVASELGIAVSTVNDYVRRVRVKYELAGRPAYTKIELYMRAVEDGILPQPGSTLT